MGPIYLLYPPLPTQLLLPTLPHEPCSMAKEYGDPFFHFSFSSTPPFLTLSDLKYISPLRGEYSLKMHTTSHLALTPS